jgi:ribosome-binding protein aMBF1 (putative translation factor)
MSESAIDTYVGVFVVICHRASIVFFSGMATELQGRTPPSSRRTPHVGKSTVGGCKVNKVVANMNAGDYIRLTRERQNLSLRQLAKKSGVPFATIARMESNKDAMFSSVVRVADALGISLLTIADLAETDTDKEVEA